MSAEKLPTHKHTHQVMIHSGSIRGGHYFAYIKDFARGKWSGLALALVFALAYALRQCLR